MHYAQRFSRSLCIFTIDKLEQINFQVANLTSDLSNVCLSFWGKQCPRYTVVLIVGGAVVGTIFLLKNKDKDDKDKTKGDSAESTVSAYYDAILNGDVDAMMSLVPDNYLDYMIETYDIDEDAVKDELQTLMEDELADWADAYGANIELTVKCNDEEVAEQSEIDDLNDELEESGWDFTITEGYTYSVDVTFNGDDDEYTETYDDVAVLKVDGKWFNSDAMSMITDAATEAYYNS